jgi:hypothetical protein
MSTDDPQSETAASEETHPEMLRLRHEAKLAEYNTLRAEILGYQRDSVAIIAFSVAFCTAAFGYAVVSQFPAVAAFAALSMSAPLLLQIQRIRSTYRIGRYIEIFLEGDDSGLSYESRHAIAQKNRRTSKGRLDRNDETDKLTTFKMAVVMPILSLQIIGLVCALNEMRDYRLASVLILACGPLLILAELLLVRKADCLKAARTYWEKTTPSPLNQQSSSADPQQTEQPCDDAQQSC